MANGALNFGSGNGNWLRPCNHERKLLIGPEHTFHWLQWRTSCSKLRAVWRLCSEGNSCCCPYQPNYPSTSIAKAGHSYKDVPALHLNCQRSSAVALGAESIVFHVSFCNPHITVKMVGHQNLGMMQKMGKLAKTSHKSFSCICWCLSCSSFLCDLSCLSYLYILWEISPDRSLYW